MIAFDAIILKSHASAIERPAPAAAPGSDSNVGLVVHAGITFGESCSNKQILKFTDDIIINGTIKAAYII